MFIELILLLILLLLLLSNAGFDVATAAALSYGIAFLSSTSCSNIDVDGGFGGFFSDAADAAMDVVNGIRFLSSGIGLNNGLETSGGGLNMAAFGLSIGLYSLVGSMTVLLCKPGL